jgi:adenylate cyclase
VRRAGPSLRITAELVDSQTGRQLWSEKYAGTMDDVFDVQERVSREIVRALDVTLSADEDRRLADRPVADPRAFELYLQARQALRHYKVPQGVALLERAIAIEGTVPALRYLRGLAHVIEVRTGMNRDLAPLDLAEAEARALVAEAPEAPYGHALLGFIGYERGDLREGVAALERALERDPTDADCLFFLGISLTAAGQCEQVMELAGRLIASDPLSPLANMLAGVATWFIGRAGETLGPAERAVELDPDSLIGRWTLGYFYALIGRLADAAVQSHWLDTHAPNVPYSIQLRALLAALEGRREEALALVATVDTSALDGHNTFHIAEVYAMAGDAPRALALCEQAVDGNFYPVPFLATHCPFIAPLRGTPEFARVLEKAERRMRAFTA